MLAALSIADESLFERMMDATFPQRPPADSATDTPGSRANGQAGLPQIGTLVIGQVVKDKTVATVQACKEMLLQEPPERMTEFWGTVSSRDPLGGAN